MRHERATEELKELAALYALGSLTQQEARSFESHLKEGCSVCESEFRKYDRAVARIGLAAEEAVAPEYIRDLLQARVEREPKIVLSKARPAIQENHAAQTKPARPAAAAVPSLLSPPREKPSIFPWVLVITIACLGILAFYAWTSAKDANTRLEARLLSLQADSEGLKTSIESLTEKSKGLDRILAMAGRPTSRLARLAVQATPAASSAAVLWDTAQNECLVFGRFPPPPEGKRYQLWFFAGTARVSAGVIDTGAAGETLVTIAVPAEAAYATAAVITLEPDNGSQIPTYPFYAAGRIE